MSSSGPEGAIETWAKLAGFINQTPGLWGILILNLHGILLINRLEKGNPVLKNGCLH